MHTSAYAALTRLLPTGGGAVHAHFSPISASLITQAAMRVAALPCPWAVSQARAGR